MTEPKFKPGDLVINKEKHLILILEIKPWHYECLTLVFRGTSYSRKPRGIDQEDVDKFFISIQDFVK